MTASRRVGFQRAALIGALAVGLAACGVKGPLEAPPRDKSAAQAVPDQRVAAADVAETEQESWVSEDLEGDEDPTTLSASASSGSGASRSGSSRSGSSVRRTRPPSMEPSMPPKEWSRIGRRTPQQPRRPSASKGSGSTEPAARPQNDKPFILDGLL